MSIPGSASPLFFQTAAAADAAAAGPTRSLRFNSGDSAYLNRTPSSAGNRKTWTWSAWVKRSALGTTQKLFSAGTSSNYFALAFNTSDKIQVDSYGTGANPFYMHTGDMVFRDVSAWYSVVAVLNTTESTGSDRFKLYINGSQVTLTVGTNVPPSDADQLVNSTIEHKIGNTSYGSASQYFDGYLADIYFVDGAALDPTSFGAYDDSGVWQAKTFSGSVNHDPSYGLSSSDIVSSTGFQSGEGADKVIDSTDPTANRAHTVAGNAGEKITVTFSPAVTVNTSLEIYAYLTVSGDSEERRARVNGGDWFNPTSTADTYHDLGFTGSLSKIEIEYNGSTNSRSMTMRGIRIDGNFVHTGTAGVNGFHLKFDDNSSNAALGTDSGGSSNTFTVNNIQATNTGNSGGFQAVTWTGNGSTQAITTTGMSPDFVWIKSRSNVEHHSLNDSVRGANKQLESSRNIAETTHSNILTSFDSTGFTLSSSDAVNKSSATYVGFCWKAGGAASSNSDGTITSSVSASTEYGFSVVTFTGPASAGFGSVGHGLGQKPKLIFCKDRDNNRNWSVFHEDVITSDTDILSLNQDIATFTSGTAAWDVSAIDSSTFTPYFRDDFGASFGADNVAYCWAEKSGYSKFGTYTGNGNTSGAGPRVELGFKPAFLLVKGFDVQSGWRIFDSTRDPGGQFQKRLYADEAGTESTNSTQYVDYDDTGFDVEASGSLSTYNVNNKTYIYMAFAQNPGVDVIDSLLDVPTNGTQSDTGAGGEVSGNYATLNAAFGTVTGSTNSPENGNLTVDGGSSANFSPTTIPVTSGKWYVEVTVAGSGNSSTVGIWKMPMTYGTNYYQNENYRYYQQDGKIYDESGATSTTYNTYAAGDVIGIALDMDNGKVFFSKNGTFQGSSVPASGTNPAASGLSGTWAIALQAGASTSHTLHLNAGQRSFSYSAPTGFKALCTTNLPTPTIADGSDHFYALTSTGTFGGGTVTDSDANFTPDLVWVKRRNAAERYKLYDILRGTDGTRYKHLESDGNDAEGSGETGLTAFVAGGYTSEGGGHINSDGQPFISWMWNAGTSTASNTDGSVTSSVRANQTAGFSIVSWTNPSSGSTAFTVGHGLNAAPGLIILKSRSNTGNWNTFHSSSNTDTSKFLNLNTTDNLQSYSGLWGSALPTSSVFGLGGNFRDGYTMIAYCISPVAGYSAVGSYEGNSSTDGPFIHTGFRVAWLMIKNITDSGWSWNIYDTSRDPINANNKLLRPDYAASEIDAYAIDFLSNGFKLKWSDGSINHTSKDYIYVALAENPFQANGGLAR